MTASSLFRRYARCALVLLALAQAACAQRTGPDVPRPFAAANDEVLHWNQPADRAGCPDRNSYL
ncbi:hypothetical protein, partial [Pseudoxanthomonas sp. KAs_5_3]